MEKTCRQRTLIWQNSKDELEYVQEYLGHSNIKTTADIYGHLDMMRKNQLSDLLESQIL